MNTLLNITLNKIRIRIKYLICPMVLSCALLCVLSACGSDSQSVAQPLKQTSSIGDSQSSNLPIPDNRFANNYQVLLFGNSHVSSQANLIARLIATGNPNAQVKVVNAGGGFLDDKLSQQRRANLLITEPWTHVILQGQKYSQSGISTFSTAEARVWIAKAKAENITPILFPEHPQRGRLQEGRLVHDLHSSIAAQQKACVAPVGLTWDKVILTEPTLNLHLSDGNHASLVGNMLTALVFYEVITGESADLLPYIIDIEIDETTQQLLGQIATETIKANQPCVFE